MDQNCVRPIYTKRKMLLWYTRTFKPIMTHNDLEPIMINLGFLALQPSPPTFSGGYAWKEYVYNAGVVRPFRDVDLSSLPPRPRVRLPYPRIDGLHMGSYEAFLDAINFYVKIDDMSLLFHVRALPIKRADLCYEWLEDCVYFYRDGTFHNVIPTPDSDKNNKEKNNDDDDDSLDQCLINCKGRSSKPFRMVPFTDIIVQNEGSFFRRLGSVCLGGSRR